MVNSGGLVPGPCRALSCPRLINRVVCAASPDGMCWPGASAAGVGLSLPGGCRCGAGRGLP